MSVLKRNRAESKVEYMKNGYMLIRVLTYETMRDFGTKKHIRDYKLLKKDASDDELAILEELESKIGDLNKRIVLQLPEDYMAEVRSKMYELILDFDIQLSEVYTWVSNKDDLENRLISCKEAIRTLWKIKNIYTAVDDIDGGQLKMFCKIINMIDKEVILLKGVRDYIKRQLKKLEENG